MLLPEEILESDPLSTVDQIQNLILDSADFEDFLNDSPVSPPTRSPAPATTPCAESRCCATARPRPSAGAAIRPRSGRNPVPAVPGPVPDGGSGGTRSLRPGPVRRGPLGSGLRQRRRFARTALGAFRAVPPPGRSPGRPEPLLGCAAQVRRHVAARARGYTRQSRRRCGWRSGFPCIRTAPRTSGPPSNPAPSSTSPSAS